MPGRSSTFRGVDPLERMLEPPTNETEQGRRARLAAEMEAKRISDKIDEELQREEKAWKRGQKPLKVLLLGQSESGKSTTLKNFQLMNSPKAFRAERASWRAVIHLNVVRSIRIILEAMSEAQAVAYPPSPDGSRPNTSRGSPASETPQLTADHLKLKMRLSPLLQVEEALIRKLTPAGSAEFEATHLAQPTSESYLDRVRTKEVAVNSQFAWKGMFRRLMPDARASMESEMVDWEDPGDPGRILHACSDDMIRLWEDETIQALLRANHLMLEDQPGFFLDSLPRITAPRYVPTDDDVLRARLKTLGVTEYKFSIKDGERYRFIGEGMENLRCRRPEITTAWAPYFDDMNAILFLAPISCFDQVLVEDPTVNRLEDSVLLWKSIVANPLLSKTNIVLFLNKVDIFRAKLAAGIQLSKYIVSYGDRPNDYESTSSYLRRKFAKIYQDHSPLPRHFYCHFTMVTDTKATANLLADVQDTVIMQNLKESRLIA